MANGLNPLFVHNTQWFLQNMLVTGTAIVQAIPNIGVQAFDLIRQNVNGVDIAMLRPFNPMAVAGPGLHDAPIQAYWVPQGGSTFVPVGAPAGSLVLTPDFSGCHLMVDQATPTMYRVYHVQGGQEQAEYLGPLHNHGLGQAGGLTFPEYGTAMHPRAFAFMKRTPGGWRIFYQSQDQVGIGYNALTNAWNVVGNLQVSGGGELPVADIRTEIPRTTPAPPNMNVVGNPALAGFINPHRNMLPNAVFW